ncbi:tetraacyldisaccharide 4'-kinase [Leptospira levettii]|uniref:Tetraacyldisaccharide 4'-kinase n=1 Tax=Leptospira levettii TaxID=2023178 RepID=A0AAW5VCT9_9LEPT|nr:tetraacyldisaccharide 4'-kinase [Leptospira levettii]MCW7464554.1 tetraacyldisaccharide 4'-kinase [Leptospira levettii]MCW7511262.1 tetraacyldisaccharide 4'-kinase [Leptospira levettii]MCW7515016.1 tetraacyldisaccharide 4'-kinase [Leptospira levettii]
MKVFFTLFLPLTWLYQFLFWFSQGRKKTTVLPNTLVISVGNITVGGTGKTPFVQYLVQYFQKANKGYAITILSRGYKAKLSKEGAILTDGHSPNLFGDEPSEHKERFPGVQVMIGQNRIGSFFKYNQIQSKQHIVILDDGFQHNQIHRDFDIVLLDNNAPFGNGFTIPLGYLREPISHLNRANVIVFTKITETNQKEFEKGKGTLDQLGIQLPTFGSSFQADAYQINLDTFEQSLVPKNSLMQEASPSDSYFLFTGVGNPNHVLETTISTLNTKQIQSRFFPDHYEFEETVLLSLLDGKDEKTIFVTTEKDWVKVRTQIKFIEEMKRKKMQLFVIRVDVVLHEQSVFESMLAHLVSTYEVKNGLVSKPS